uniref:Kinetochore protein Spc24 n=1 Tax=Saccoglossus kowalevskii TaxID=10224 RepID=A0ABM0ME50_SACKO|nr:PREDICTED: kinetochore protein spc24-like isoform X1 [Saccoglossus kowalevskii]XP_006818291.1 PREDICTED: kinetochore protein spc24-like isoform X2 [Saccoglossus kowalevskii]
MTDYAEEGMVFVKELTEHLRLNQEADAIKHLGQQYRELHQLQCSQQQQMKDDIMRYTKLNEERAKLIANDNSLEEIQNQELIANGEYQKIQAHSKDQLKESESLDKRIEEEKKKKEKNEKLSEDLAEQTKDSLVKTRLKVDLYQNMLNIQWDYDCDSNTVNGFVSTKHDVRPFSLNKQQNSQFFITNYLWDLVEAAHQEPTLP